MGGKSGGGTAQPQTVPATRPAIPAAATGTPTGGKGAGKGGGGVAQLQQRFQDRMANQPATVNAPAIGGMGTTGGIASLAQAPQSSMFADASGNAGAGTATVDPYAPQATGIAGIPGTEAAGAAWNKIQQMRALQGVSGPKGIGKGLKGGGGEPQRQFMQQQTPNGVAPPMPTLTAQADNPAFTSGIAALPDLNAIPIAADIRRPPPPPPPVPAPAAAAPAASAAPAQLSDVARHMQNLAALRARGGLGGANR